TPNEDPRLVALREWRAGIVARHPSASALRHAALRLIVTAGSRTAEEITTHLPASWHRFAPEIAEVLADAAPGDERTGPDQARSESAAAPGPSAPADRRAPGLAGLQFAHYHFVPSDHPVVRARSSTAGTAGPS